MRGMAWTEDQQRRVLAFLEELAGGVPLDELRRQADAARDSANLDDALVTDTAARAGELLADLGGQP